MTKYFTFSCGCKFPVLQEEPLRLTFGKTVEDIPLNCSRTWDLICSGKTKGCFQLESQLAQTYLKKTKSRSEEELSDVIALIRPGCLDAVFEKKSVTDHYVDRKSGEEEVTYLSEHLEPILNTTYGLLVYQEQALKIARDISNFDPMKIDKLRKIVGKKQADEMIKIKKGFLEGCKEKGLISEEKAEQLFHNIEAGQRYSFNKSHSVSYALTAYQTAYLKAHFPKVFFTSCLYYAKEKQKPRDEIYDLVQDARLFDIDVYPPSFRNLNQNFKLIDEKIYFGLTDIKGIGESVVRKMAEEISNTEKELGKPLNDWTWIDFLLFFSPYVNSSAVKAMICSGCLDYMGVHRTLMYYQFENISTLRDKEMDYLRKKSLEDSSLTLYNLLSCLTKVPSGRKHGGCSNKNRLKAVEDLLSILESPPFNLEDSILWIAGVEEELLGISLTCTKVDDCEIEAANCNCRQFIKGYRRPGPILIACKVDKVKEIVTKKKQDMAFLTVSDISASLGSVVCFPHIWYEYKNLCFEGNTIMIQGKRGDKDKDNFMVDKIWQI